MPAFPSSLHSIVYHTSYCRTATRLSLTLTVLGFAGLLIFALVGLTWDNTDLGFLDLPKIIAKYPTTPPGTAPINLYGYLGVYTSPRSTVFPACFRRSAVPREQAGEHQQLQD